MLRAGIDWERDSSSLLSLIEVLVHAHSLTSVLCIIYSLAGIAKRRPSMFGRILPVLLALAPNCEPIKGGQVASVIHSLKSAFLILLKCNQPGAVPVCSFIFGFFSQVGRSEQGLLFEINTNVEFSSFQKCLVMLCKATYLLNLAN